MSALSRTFALLLALPSLRAEAAISGLTLSSSHTNPPVGTAVTWTAGVTASNGPVEYQLEMAIGATGAWERVRSFTASTTFVWVPVDQQTTRWRVTAREVNTPGVMASTDRSITTASRSSAQLATLATLGAGGTHPLVAHYSAPASACGAGWILRAEHRPLGSTGAWDHTSYKPCAAGRSTNHLVAGLLPSTTYEVRYSKRLGNNVVTGSTTTQVTTGLPPAELPVGAPSAASGSSDDLIFGLLIPDSDGGVWVNDTSAPPFVVPMATNLDGEIVWYYPGYAADPTGVATGLTPENTVLLLADDGLYPQQILREVDLAGNVVREVHIDAVNEELEALGYGPDAMLAFDHEAVRFSPIVAGGETFVKLSEPREVDDQWLLGDAIAALDAGLHVTWVWDTFDHLPTDRGPTGGAPAVCGQGSPGCPPIKGYPTLIDWTHGNAIAPAPDGDLLFSMRNQDWVAHIDGVTGEVEWLLGGTAAANTAAAALAWPQGSAPPFLHARTASGALAPQTFAFDHQHGVNYEDSEHITLFDNGNTRCNNGLVGGCVSRGQVWRIDEVAMTATRELNTALPAFSPALGMAQQLTDGGHHFTVGALFSTDPAGVNWPYSLHVEVDTGGAVSWDQEIGGSSYRTYRLPDLYTPSLWDRTSL